MSSYIKFMFKYLFEPEALSAELLDHGSNTSAADVFALPPSNEQLGPLQQVVDWLPSSSSSSGQLAKSSPSVSLTIINKSSGSSTSSSVSKLILVGQQQRRPLASDWLWLQQRQQQSADDGGGGGGKLWPSKCLNFVRLFAMAQSNSSGATSSASASLSGPTAAAVAHNGAGQLDQLSSPAPNGLLVRLGSFAEFEHLIRQQLAAAGPFLSSTNSSNNNNNNSDSQQNNNNNNNSHWHRPARGAAHTTTSSPAAAFASDSFAALAREPAASPRLTATPASGSDSPSGNALLRLLIRSIEAEPQDVRPSTGLRPIGSSLLQGAPTMATTNATMVSSAGVNLSSVPLPGENVSSSELLDCYRGLQLAEYHQNYDIFIGLRIASTLTILFVVFILFVIYKTGCRNGDRPSRSQLRLTSASSNSASGGSKPNAIEADGPGGWPTSRRPQRGRTRPELDERKRGTARTRPPDWSSWTRAADKRTRGGGDAGHIDASPAAQPPEPKATN